MDYTHRYLECGRMFNEVNREGPYDWTPEKYTEAGLNIDGVGYFMLDPNAPQTAIRSFFSVDRGAKKTEILRKINADQSLVKCGTTTSGTC